MATRIPHPLPMWFQPLAGCRVDESSAPITAMPAGTWPLLTELLGHLGPLGRLVYGEESNSNSAGGSSRAGDPGADADTGPDARCAVW